jgi:hypothetical protein
MMFSIGRGMISVAILAIAFSVVSLDIGDRHVHRRTHDLIVGTLPMATILAYGLLGATIDLAAGRPSRRHLVGFQAAGWASIFAYLAWCTATYEWSDRPLSWIGRATGRAINRGFAYDHPGILAAHMSAFLTPELAIAALAGWLGSRLGVVLVRQGGVQNRGADCIGPLVPDPHAGEPGNRPTPQ